MQMPGAQHLRPKHLLEALPALVGERAVRQHAHAVDHARQGRQFLIHAGQHPIDRRRVRHVRQFHFHTHAAVPERADGLFGGFVGRAPSVQHDVPCAAFGEPIRHRATDSSQAARHQVGTVRPQPAVLDRRVGHDNLSEVPGRAHEAQRCARFGQRPSAVNDRLQLACSYARHHAPQDLADPGRFGLLQYVQLKDVIGHVGPYGRHFLLAQDVAPGHLHETAALPEAGQAGIDVALAREAVQHHIDAFAAGGLENFFAERRRAAVKNVFHAERPEIVPLGRAGGGKHLRSRGLDPLDSRQAHSACARVDQDPFARFKPRELEGQRGRNVGAGDRGEFANRKSVRRGSDEFPVRDHFPAERAKAHSDHMVAGLHVGHVGAGIKDVTAHFAAEHALLDESQRPENVPEVETGGLDLHPDLVRVKGPLRQGLNKGFVENAVRVGRQHPVRFIGQVQPLRAGALPNQAGR